MMNMVLSVISQDPELTVEEAAELAANAKRAALAMFPDKELAYDILYKPRLQRVIAERFPRAVGQLFADAGEIDRQRSPEEFCPHLHQQMAIVVGVPDPHASTVLQHCPNCLRSPLESSGMFRQEF